MEKLSLKNSIIKIFLWISKMISLTVIIFFLLELISFQIIKMIPMLTGIVNSRSLKNLELDARVNCPQYTDKIYAKKIFSDLSKYHERYYPYTGWISGVIQSSTLNIDKNGIRKTYCPPVNQPVIKNNKQIFVFGASTVFGLGTDDNNTIPSFLSKIINKNSKKRYKVINFGTPAYISSQELNRLIIELRNNNIPDYVIIYNGIADIYAGAYNPGIPGAHFHYFETAVKYNSSGLINLIFSSYTLKLIGYIKERLFLRYSKSGIDDIDYKITETLKKYKKNIEIIHALSKSFKFKYYVFFQPVLCATKKPMTQYEKMIYNNSGVLNIIFNKAYGEIKNVDFKGYNYYNISDVFDKIDKDVYIDFCHVGAFGKEIVSQIIYKYIQKDIH